MCIQIKQTFEFKLRLVLMDKQFISYKLNYITVVDLLDEQII